MHKSISAWAFAPQRPALELFQMAREHGFSHVEVTLDRRDAAMSHQVTPDSTQAECERVREQAGRCGVTLSSLAVGLGWELPMTAQDAPLRAQAVEVHRRALQIAAWLGVDALLCVPGGVWASFIPGFPLTPYDVAYENGLDSLRQLAPFAEQVGVTLAVENVWNNFLLSPLEFRDFVDAVGSSRVQAYFDVGNVLQTGFPEQWIAILGSRIARVHFKDFQRSINTLDGFCALGEGDADYPAVMKALRKIGYNNSVTAEFFDCEADLPAISQAMDAILESEI